MEISDLHSINRKNRKRKNWKKGAQPKKSRSRKKTTVMCCIMFSFHFRPRDEEKQTLMHALSLKKSPVNNICIIPVRKRTLHGTGMMAPIRNTFFSFHNIQMNEAVPPIVPRHLNCGPMVTPAPRTCLRDRGLTALHGDESLNVLCHIWVQSMKEAEALASAKLGEFSYSRNAKRVATETKNPMENLGFAHSEIHRSMRGKTEGQLTEDQRAAFTCSLACFGVVCWSLLSLEPPLAAPSQLFLKHFAVTVVMISPPDRHPPAAVERRLLESTTFPALTDLFAVGEKTASSLDLVEEAAAVSAL